MRDFRKYGNSTVRTLLVPDVICWKDHANNLDSWRISERVEVSQVGVPSHLQPLAACRAC